MKKTIRTFIASLMVVLGIGVIIASPAGAINVFEQCDGASNNKDTSVCKAQNEDDVDSLVQIGIGILSFIIGIISVIMIIVGGIRYVVSNGEAAKVKSAKDTILYAIVGLVVSLLAYVIVNFVVGQFT